MPRVLSLDIVRGLIITLMIFAHVIFFTHDFSDPVFAFINAFSNVIIFTSLLTISGASTYIAYLETDRITLPFIRRLLRRILIYILGYYLLATLAEFSKFILASSSQQQLSLLWKIATFQIIPNFTEFIITFIVYEILVIFLRKFLKSISSSISLVSILSAIFYLTGSVLYKLEVAEQFIYWKSIFVGHSGIYSFPVFQYFPVFLLGLTIGRMMVKAPYGQNYKKFLLITGLGSLIIFALSLYFGILFKVPFESLSARWPPSPIFLVEGIAFVCLAIWIVEALKNLRGYTIQRDFLLIFGQNAYAIFWSHLFLLFAFREFGGLKIDSIWLVMAVFIVVLSASLYLAKILPFNYSFAFTFVRYCECELFHCVHGEETRLVKKLNAYFLRIFSLPSLLFSQLTAVRARALFKISSLLLISLFFIFAAIGLLEKLFVKDEALDWWNNNYSHSRQMVIKNKNKLLPLPTDSIVVFTIDHQKLVSQKKSHPKGNDIHIVYWTGKNYIESERVFINSPHTANTQVGFKLSFPIAPSAISLNYSIYYGDLIEKSDFGNFDPSKDNIKTDAEIEFGKETKYPVFGSISKNWVLKETNVTKDVDLSVTYSVVISSEVVLENPTVSYQIEPSQGNGDMIQTSKATWEARLAVDDLAADNYKITATITDSENNISYKSSPSFLFISYPLYVSWTIDWEGYDVPDASLVQMAQISDKHKVPMTHLFNPRIYTAPDIPKERSNYLTMWVKERQEKFDEDIGLHLHMFPDFVTDSQVIPKQRPNWGAFFDDGYDVPMTVYTKEEVSKMLERAKYHFEINGLGYPTIFRSGGWYANLETLKAIDEAGFLIDTSGRTKYRLGKNGLPGTWELQTTTTPYKISSSNQNLSLPPTLNLWEFPNNGGDSFAFTGEALTNRFWDNFSHLSIITPQQLTYLSHPQWFVSKEGKEIEKLFSTTDNYLYQNDAGPVIYKTLTQISGDWIEE